MKTKIFIFLVILLLLLSNCAKTPTSRVSIQPTSIFTSSSLPSITSTEQPIPSATAMATFAETDSATVESRILGGLSSPPYLVYVKKINGKEQVVLVNQDGSGLKTMPLPDNGFSAGNPSPTGEWLVFYTGSGGLQTLTDGPTFDLALNLMHLPDGATHKITDLLSKDFPNNLVKFAEIAKDNDQDIATMDSATIVDLTRQDLIYRLMLSQWSSSGKILAFAGEMDGPSTDLYLHNLKTSDIQRLSSGSKNIDFIKWFPHGNEILYSSSYLPCEGDCSTYYVTNLDGSLSRQVSHFDTFGGGTFMDSWSDNSFLTMYTRANGIGTCCLRNFDFENDKVNMLYGGEFQNYAYDPQTNLLVISIADNLENIPPGTYFVDQNGMRRVEGLGWIYYLGWQNFPFILSANGTKLLSSSGAAKVLAEQELIPFAARNNRYVALCDWERGQTNNGLKVFDNNGNLVVEITGQKITRVVWRIDSQGLFYVTNKQLYYVGIQDKTPVLIDSHLNDGEFDTGQISFNWVR